MYQHILKMKRVSKRKEYQKYQTPADKNTKQASQYMEKLKY
jgi:hypothetical protein